MWCLSHRTTWCLSHWFAITEITDSLGSFAFTVSESGPVQIISDGYYFSELTGEISSGTLALKAIYNASSDNEQQAYVNVLTHLINNRVLQLIENGEMSIQEAIDQAQAELVAELQSVLPVESIPNFSELSVYNDNPENSIGNGYLLALSTSFYKYAEIEAKGRETSADAQLALILNLIAQDFASDGIIQREGFMDDLRYALRSLNPRAISEKLRNRSEVDFAEAIDVPDITNFFGLCAGAGDCMWSAAAPMPFPARSHASAVYDGKIYVFGGDTPFDEIDEATLELGDSAAKGAFVYAPSSNEWTALERLPIGMRYVNAHTIGDKIYLFGGYGKGGFLNC